MLLRPAKRRSLFKSSVLSVAIALILVATFVMPVPQRAGAQAAARTHAIIDLRDGCLLGGVQNQKWIPAKKLGKGLQGTHSFSLYTLNSPTGNITAKVGKHPDCEEQWSAAPSREVKNGIAIDAPTWDPQPRIPRAIDLRDITYVKIIRDILTNGGIKKPDVKITEGYKIDLDGDGKDEVVIIASRYELGVGELSGLPRGNSPGDYSLVLIRRIIDDKVRNIFLVKDIRLAADEGGLSRGYHLSSIADLNGDGLMELALYSAYYEGSGTVIIEINGIKATGVLWCGCEH